MDSKTLTEAFPDTTMDEFLSQNPEISAKAEAFRFEQEENGRKASYFRQQLDKIETEKMNLNWLEDRLNLYSGANIPERMLEVMRASGSGYLGLEGVAVNMAAAALIKQFAPELRKLAAKNLADMESKFNRFKAENAAVLKKLELI